MRTHARRRFRMAFKGKIEMLGGNGLVGYCLHCEDVTPAFPRKDGKGYQCMNHGPDTEPKERTVGRKWTRTTRHMLIVLNEVDAFCRSCQSIVRHVPWGKGERRCYTAVQNARPERLRGAKGVVETVWDEPAMVPSTCRVCGETFRSLGLFDDHLPTCPGIGRG
jgi:hypothetical protein